MGFFTRKHDTSAISRALWDQFDIGIYQRALVTIGNVTHMRVQMFGHQTICDRTTLNHNTLSEVTMQSMCPDCLSTLEEVLDMWVLTQEEASGGADTDATRLAFLRLVYPEDWFIRL